MCGMMIAQPSRAVLAFGEVYGSVGVVFWKSCGGCVLCCLEKSIVPLFEAGMGCFELAWEVFCFFVFCVFLWFGRLIKKFLSVCSHI
jgi:hypothetical protein